MRSRIIELLNRRLAAWDAILLRKSFYEQLAADVQSMRSQSAADAPAVAATQVVSNIAMQAAMSQSDANSSDTSMPCALGVSRETTAQPVSGTREPDYEVNLYGDSIPWEKPVQLCLRDFLKPGDCALDIGANVGGLAIAMSRFVGPTGSVHAFEANPEMVKRLVRDLEANSARNVTVVPKAVWRTSGETLTLHIDNSHYSSASSLMHAPPSSHDVEVQTISVDDYCCQAGCSPQAIKIDVEGAEFHVLSGARETLERCKPAIVLEYCPPASPEVDAIVFLQSLGYALLDVNLCQPVDREYYLSADEKPTMVNILAVHKDTAPWPADGVYFRVEPVVRLDVARAATDFVWLEPGRYVAALEFEAPCDLDAIVAVSDKNGQRLSYYQGPAGMLARDANSHLVFEINEPLQVQCLLGTDRPAEAYLKNVQISRVRRAV